LLITINGFPIVEKRKCKETSKGGSYNGKERVTRVIERQRAVLKVLI
jgi:hypothetical protein